MAVTNKDISANQLTQELDWISANGTQCPRITLNYVQETLQSLDMMVPSVSFKFKDPVGWPTCLNGISSDGSGCMIGGGYAYPRDMDWTLRNVHSGRAFKGTPNPMCKRH
uniref:Uncharacterized protein n=1 Tax=Ditylenchus dipsaci TaxID=166011 RepID=A0A915ECJ8_9BILA